MSRIRLFQGLLMNIKGEIQPGRREFLPKKEALEMLKRKTGQDFGEDVSAWEKWVEKNDNCG